MYIKKPMNKIVPIRPTWDWTGWIPAKTERERAKIEKDSQFFLERKDSHFFKEESPFLLEHGHMDLTIRNACLLKKISMWVGPKFFKVN